MARKTRTFLALVLSALLSLGTIPVPAFAETGEETMGVEPISSLPESIPDSRSESNGEPAPAEPGFEPQNAPQAVADGYARGGIAGPPVPTVHDANETPSLSTQSSLPSAYSSVDQFITPVRNQNPQGTCWAFALTAVVEASMLRSGMVPSSSKDTFDLSERHLAYFTFNTPPDPLGNTGNDRMGVQTSDFVPDPYYGGMLEDRWSYLNNSCSVQLCSMTLANWTGAAAEEVAPYTPLNYMNAYYYDTQMTYADFLAMTALDNDIARSSVAHVKDIHYISRQDSDKIKQAVMDHGAVTASLNTDQEEAMTFKEDASGKQRAYAFYSGDGDSDHSVAIVGWDDSVSREMFSSDGSNLPACDGAWLCKNSWGTRWSADGYFWLSYDDKFAKSDGAALAVTVEPTDAEDNLYMHDGGAATYCNFVDSGGDVASVFEAKANDAGELLDAVSFLTWSSNVDYSVQVYMDPQRPGDPTSGTAMLAEPIAGKVEFAGLHKIGLPQGEEVPLYPGARYAVVVTLSHADGTQVEYGVDVDVSGESYYYTSEIEAFAGESYERNNPDSAWKDLATTTDIDPYDERNCTARLRAYTKNADLTSRASLERAQIVPILDQFYSGAEIRPALKVVVDGHVLREGTDFTASWGDNVDVGTATVTVTGKGVFSDSASATFTIKPATKTFPDVAASDWFAGVVSRATGLGLINGYADGRFGPNDPITRGQVAVVLWNMAGGPAVGTGAKSFTDVAADKYYYDAVRWASGAGVVSGYGDGTRFGPDDKVTREQLAAMLANYAEGVAKWQVTGSADDYAGMGDAESVSDWARTAVGWCFQSKILSGSAGLLRPHGNASRAEASKMIVFLHDLLG